MGIIVIPLFIIGLLGWYYIVELSFFFLREHKFLKSLQPISLNTSNTYHKKSLVKTYLYLVNHYQEQGIEEIEEQIEKKLGFVLVDIEQRLHSIKIFAATAPLLGLLGTVNGMIVTFELISYYGNSSPILLSDGISEALLSTQSGLVIAFPLLLFQAILSNRNKELKNHLQSILAKAKN